jgi:isoleucyl-tRNA synthetase
VRERLTGFMMTLNNCLRFYELYRQEHRGAIDALADASSTHLLDKWILSRLSEVTALATGKLDAYDITVAARELERFVVVDFSQWWLRRSRKRTDALPLLRHLLRSLSLLLAPFIPYTAEEIWQKVKGAGDALSVHLADWPATGDATAIDTQLHDHMTQVREFISAGLAIRKDNQIKVRQPLQSVTVPGKPLHADLEELIRDELNVKQIIYQSGAEVSLDMHIGTELRAEGFAREVMRTVQDMRKEAGCQVSDRVYCQWFSDDAEVTAALLQFGDMITRDTGLSAFVHQSDDKTLTIEKNFDLASGKPLWIGIRL